MPTAAPPAEALQLSESISLAIEEGASTIFDSDGCVPVHIIRPGVGKGKGRHLYEASMLARDAHKFSGWRMYVDHQAPEARRAAGGLPRSIRDLGGRIVESKWDSSVPADPKRGFGQGAVVGRARPVRYMRELIEDDPGLVEASISASATGVRPVQHQGQRVWMVEGINDRGSVDWVTEAGAGGRVAPLLEASYSSEEAVEMALLESMSDEEVKAWLTDARPNLRIVEADDYEDDDDDVDDEAKAKLKRKGMSEEDAAKFARNAKKNKITESEEDDMPLTPEALREALSAHPEVLVEALQGTNLQEVIDSRVEERLRDERELAEAERDAVINRRIELRDMRDEAARLISAAKQLPDSWKEGLAARFSLSEAQQPTRELDLVDEVDASGATTKSAMVRLREAVDSAIKSEQRKLAEVAPTRVRGQGPSTLQEGEDANTKPAKPAEKPYYAQVLEEAGIDPDKAYAA